MAVEYKVTWYPTDGGIPQPPQCETTRDRNVAEMVYQQAKRRKQLPIMERREVSPWETVKSTPYDDQRSE